MTRVVIKYILLLVSIPAIVLAQKNEPGKKIHLFNNAQDAPASIINTSKVNSLIKTSTPDKQDDIKNFFAEKHTFAKPQNKSKIESAFSLVSSVRKNIRFAGFWRRFAILNFTPNVYLQPSDNVSIFANHTYSCFIPIKGIKEHFKMLCIQGASILAVDNAVKFIFGSDKMIPAIAGFALKTIIINSVMSTINKGKKTKIHDNVSYRYSINIRF
jgi:hypothetical protein